MPGTLEAAIVFTLVIAPGYLGVRGFSVGRTHLAPARDLYVLAEAIVVSIVWLAVVLHSESDRLAEYGLLPREDTLLEKHQEQIATLLLVVVLLPYLAGRLLGWGSRQVARVLPMVFDRIETAHGAGGPVKRRALWLPLQVSRVLRRAAFLKAPTAWDTVMATAFGRKDVATVHLKDGGMVRGTIGIVDVSPLPPQLVLASGEGFDEQGAPLPLASGPAGVYLAGSEIRAVYFEET